MKVPPPDHPDDVDSGDDTLGDTVGSAMRRGPRFLSTLRPFKALDHEILALIHSSMSELSFDMGDVLMKQGEPGDSGSSGPDVGDNSNTQFAVLALGAAVGEGLKVGKRTLERAEAWWRSCAQPDGGFGYSSGGSTASQMSASMTAAGIASLAILGVTRSDPAKDVADSIRADAVLRAAVGRLASGFSVDGHDAQDGAFQLYRRAGRSRADRL